MVLIPLLARYIIQSLHSKPLRLEITHDSVRYKRHLEGKEIDTAALHACFVKAVADGQVVPVLCCSNKMGLGIDAVLDAIADFSPSPLEGVKRTATDLQQNLEVVVDASKDAPFSGYVSTVEDIHISDTLCNPKHPLKFPTRNPLRPMRRRSISTKTIGRTWPIWRGAYQDRATAEGRRV